MMNSLIQTTRARQISALSNLILIHHRTNATSSSSPPPPPPTPTSSPIQIPDPFESRLPYSKGVKERLQSLVPPSPSSHRNYFPSSPTSHLLPETNIAHHFTLKTLMAANLHLGHNVDSWHTNMLPYIYGSRLGIHIINLEHTISHLRRAVGVAREVAYRGGRILFVGTRKGIQKVTYDAAMNCGAFYSLHWVGGCITNRERVLRRSSGFDPDKIIQPPPIPGLDSDSASDDLRSGEGGKAGLLSQRKPPAVPIPDLIILLDYPNTFWAVHEANHAGIPVIAICDTDCDPNRVQYPIPANDDAVSSVEFIAGVLSRGVSEGVALKRGEEVEALYRRDDRRRDTRSGGVGGKFGGGGGFGGPSARKRDTTANRNY